MKKFTFLMGAFLMTASLASAQMMLPNGEFQKASDDVPVVNAAPISYESNGRKEAPKGKVSFKSIDDVLGTYVWAYNPNRAYYQPASFSFEIKKHPTSNDSIIINDFYQVGYTIRGVVNLAEGTIFLPKQNCYSGRGFTSFTPTGADWNDGAGVTLTYQGNGEWTLPVDQGWGIMVWGATSGYIWSYYSNGKAEANVIYNANCIMNWTHATNGPQQKGLYTKQEGTDVYLLGLNNGRNFVKFSLTENKTAIYNDTTNNYASLSNGAAPSTTAQYNIPGCRYYLCLYSSTNTTPRYNITMPVSDDNKTISLNEGFSYFAYSANYNPTTQRYGNYYSGYLSNATFKFDYELTLPFSPQFKGDGTAASPYQIASVDDWNMFAKNNQINAESYEGKYIKVMNNINFNGEAIASLPLEFLGNLDGNNCTLSNFTYTTQAQYDGIICTAGATASIKNLTLDGAVSSGNDANYTYCGGFIGKLYGTIDGITNKSAVSGRQVGGIVGWVETGANLLNCKNQGTVTATYLPMGGISALCNYGANYENCVNEGKLVRDGNADGTGVLGSSSLGGITGTAYNATFKNCYNVGTFQTDSMVIMIGGIIGNANCIPDPDNKQPLHVEGCYNTADMSGRGQIGGIIGQTQTGSGKTGIEVINCYNEGNITVPSGYSSYPVGGIVAVASAGKIINCYNIGDINCKGTSISYGIGGIFGRANVIFLTDLSPLQISNCYNTGNIYCDGNGYANIGGIGGYLNFANTCTIDSCYNTGNLYGGYAVAGIVGTSDSKNDNAITNCYNTGNITSMTKWSAGILGSAWKSNTTIDKCWNGGEIATEGTEGGESTSYSVATGNGIGGIVGRGGSKISNTYNTGSVKGANQVGGIIGLTNATATDTLTTITNCYNIGEIIVPNDTCGGALVGVQIDANHWRDGNAVTDSYYVTDLNAIGGNNTLGTAKTVAQLASNFNMGSVWTSIADYCTPSFDFLKEEPINLVAIAQAVLAEGETYDKVSKDINLGTPTGVTWASNNAALKVANGKATVDTESETGVNVTLTASADKVSKDIELVVFGSAGVAAIANELNVQSYEYYTIDGVRTVKPEYKDGKVYIVVMKLENGKTKTVKMIN